MTTNFQRRFHICSRSHCRSWICRNVR